MEKRKYQVFISSTFEDLEKTRLNIITTLLAIGCIPDGMELRTSSTSEPWERISSAIDECDYFVIIVAGRYGSFFDKEISWIEKEYEYALSKSIPLLVFIKDDKSITKVEEDSNQKSKNKLKEFKKRLCKEKYNRKWTTVDSLSKEINSAILNALNENPRPGWIKANGFVKDNSETRTDLLVQSLYSKYLKKTISFDFQVNQVINKENKRIIYTNTFNYLELFDFVSKACFPSTRNIENDLYSFVIHENANTIISDKVKPYIIDYLPTIFSIIQLFHADNLIDIEIVQESKEKSVLSNNIEEVFNSIYGDFQNNITCYKTTQLGSKLRSMIIEIYGQ